MLAHTIEAGLSLGPDQEETVVGILGRLLAQNVIALYELRGQYRELPERANCRISIVTSPRRTAMRSNHDVALVCMIPTIAVAGNLLVTPVHIVAGAD